MKEDHVESIDHYCDKCGSCGKSGCCPPTNCINLQCKYGEFYEKDYKVAVQLNEVFYQCLKNLGIDEPFQLRRGEAMDIGNYILYTHTIKHIVGLRLEKIRKNSCRRDLKSDDST